MSFLHHLLLREHDLDYGTDLAIAICSSKSSAVAICRVLSPSSQGSCWYLNVRDGFFKDVTVCQHIDVLWAKPGFVDNESGGYECVVRIPLLAWLVGPSLGDGGFVSARE